MQQVDGVEWRDEDTQVAFLVAELTDGTYQGQKIAEVQVGGSYTYQGRVWNDFAFDQTVSIDTQTEAFCKIFERCGDTYYRTSISTRKQWAHEYYNQFHGKTKAEDPRIGTIATSEANKQKMEEMLTDALRIADDDSYTYVWGAGRPADENTRQFDCSSFVSYMLKKYFNFDLTAQTSAIKAQGETGGYGVPLTAIQPGDVLWKDGHVAFAIGNGQTVEAMCAAKGICTGTVGSRFTNAYRFIK